MTPEEEALARINAALCQVDVKFNRQDTFQLMEDVKTLAEALKKDETSEEKPTVKVSK